jgi:hypothetical protein
MDHAGLSDIKLDGVLLEQTRKNIPDLMTAASSFL